MRAYVKSFFLLLLTGSFAASASAQGFSFNGVTNRFLTPNGDGKNDNVAFSCSDPFDSAGSIKIYDLRGHLLTTIPINSGVDACNGGPSTYPIWDGRAGGQIVSTGVYIFVIAVESVVASGAVVVIR